MEEKLPSTFMGAPSEPPWYAPGLAHIWLPYAQMKTMRPPLAVARTEGCRIVLADGRELIDGGTWDYPTGRVMRRAGRGAG